jgi:signal transduction histidine kinase
LFDLEVTLRAGRIGRLPREIETALYRTTQEAISNAARHASAQRVLVSLSRKRDCVRLTVSDDGSGFVVSKPRAAKHLGLRSITERANLLGGHAEIHSVPGQGTTVTVDLPLPRGERSPRR